MIVSLQEKRSEKMENHILCGGKWVHYKECKGNLFTLIEDDFEFEASKKSICDSLRSIDDSQVTLDSWFSVKIANERIMTPLEFAQTVAEVTREQVVEAAKGIHLNTVYRLLPKLKED